MFWFFNSKKRLKEVEEETKRGFEGVKKDIVSVSGWIKHLDSEKNLQKNEIDLIKNDLSSIKEDIEGIKNALSLVGQTTINSHLNKPFKTKNPLFNKQTGVFPVQTDVSTGVQTPNLNNFSITERAILFILLNSDMKLSYEDLASMLNKEKSTIRGQINSIKSKSESLISESIEKNGKKRLFIEDKMKEKILKKQKVSVKEEKENKKEEKEK